MKTTKMKWIGMTLWMFTALVYVGCTDDPIDKGKGGDGGNNGKDTSVSCCHLTGTVVYLPEGCIVPPQGMRIGILDENGNYFYVTEDQTGKFKDAKPGDKIRYGATQFDSCYVSFTHQNGIWAPPIHCIRLTCLEIVESEKSECDSPVEVGYGDYQKMSIPSYNVEDFKVTSNGELKLNVWFSGCEQDVEVDLIWTELPTMGITPMYAAKLDFDETMCAMVIERDLCFDISDLPENARLQLETLQGSKTILGQ